MRVATVGEIRKELVGLIESGSDLSRDEFQHLKSRVLSYQRQSCEVYSRYCTSLNVGPETFPFLPIEAFRLSDVTSFPPESADELFYSSGTTAAERSRHFVKDRSLYDAAIVGGFSRFVANGPSAILAYLPGYIDGGKNSSLIYMSRHLVSTCGLPSSRVIGNDPKPLLQIIERCRESETPVVLLGAAFGLLSLADTNSVVLPANATVIETGGMKTYRQSVSRAELHDRLATGFGLARRQIYSEYGMTELLSQAYATGGEWFSTPPWMEVQIVDPNDASKIMPDGREGAIAIIDLANLYTVSAIVTQDKGVARGDQFQVLGRLPAVELRGCNFLFE